MSNKLNIRIDQNASYGLSFSLLEDDGVTPSNITGWTFTGSIKTSYDDIVPVTFFTMSVVSVPSASISAFLSAEQTWGLSGSTYYYDFIANNPTVSPLQTYRLMYGRVTPSRGVTEP